MRGERLTSWVIKYEVIIEDVTLMSHQNKVTGLITGSFLYRGQTVLIIELAMEQWSSQFITSNCPFNPLTWTVFWVTENLLINFTSVIFVPVFVWIHRHCLACKKLFDAELVILDLLDSEELPCLLFSVQFVTWSSGSRRATIIVKSWLES